jgi:hypothetical protein
MLALTPVGEEKLVKLAEYAARHDARLDAIVGPEDKERLIRLLRMITETLDQDARRPVSLIDED